MKNRIEINFDSNADSIIIFDYDKDGYPETIGVRVLGHLNPDLCDSGYLKPLNGSIFKFNNKSYTIKASEPIVGYPQRLASWVTAVRIPTPLIDSIEEAIKKSGKQPPQQLSSRTKSIVRLLLDAADKLKR